MCLEKGLKKVSLRAASRSWWHQRRSGRDDTFNNTSHTSTFRLARMAELSLTYQRAKIEEIIHRLNQDKARWHFRRSLFMNKIISKNLLPVLIHVKNDRGLMEVTIKALQELMTPVECLMPAESMGQNHEGQRIMHELESVIVATKKLFLDTRVTKAIIDIMTSVLQQDTKEMSLPECELINQCLLLVRNLLHVSNLPAATPSRPQRPALRRSSLRHAALRPGHHSFPTTPAPTPTHPQAKQQGGTSLPVLTEDQIMWNLFAQRFDNILIQLLTCKQQHLWNITMVQLVSLMYRDQQQNTIRKLINEWLESSLSESSEDDENNPMSSSSSSSEDETDIISSIATDAISTSDPVSDSSERLSPIDGITKEEKTQINNLGKQRTRNENSDTSTTDTKREKGNSCKDSGFCYSGSNLDSSPDESMSDCTNQNGSKKQNLKLQKISEVRKPWSNIKDSSIDIDTEPEVIDETGKDIHKDKDGEFIQEKNLLNMETFTMSTDSPKDNTCEMKSIEECDSIEKVERLSDQGGNVGESDGSSPIPSVEQQLPISLMDNKGGSPCLVQFIDDQEDCPSSLEPMLLNEVKIIEPISEQGEVLGETMAPIEIDIADQKMCPSQEPVKRPPNEEESGSSGDSSINKPPPQLPKLHKNKPMIGQKRSRHTMSQKMLTDTQENNEFSNSTGSECDEGPHAKRPHHQKPHKMLSKPRPAKMIQKALQERNVKRTKLIKRKESNSTKAKALLHHQPTAEDISNLLKEFTVDFMLNGYANLLQGLRLQVLLPYQIDLDKSHVLWLITYFLRFAVELDLELSQICPVLSVDVLSYLVYEGVVMQEELERAVRGGEDNVNLVPHVRRLHLVVIAIREFFVAYDVCLKKQHCILDTQHLFRMKEELGELVEVRQLFLLLIRMYRPGVLSLNYLQDLITTNHRFLTTQEAHSKAFPQHMQDFNIYDHIKQFATMDIMRQYGRLLENFNVNDESVNDCIFTMMHHIAGDLRNVNVLLQPAILRVFLRIWQEGFELCVDWADLIEYVLRKCTRVRIEHPKKRDKDSQKSVSEPPGIELTNEDLDQLYNLYSATTSEQDLMDKIKEICCDDAIGEPIKKEVIQKLLARGFITTSECLKLCAEIPAIKPLSTKSDGDLSLECDVMQVSSDSEDSLDLKHPTLIKLGKKKLSNKSESMESPIKSKISGASSKDSVRSQESIDIQELSSSNEELKLQSQSLNGNLTQSEPIKLQEFTQPQEECQTHDSMKPNEFTKIQESLRLDEKVAALDLKEFSDSAIMVSFERLEGSIEGNTMFTEDSTYTDWDDNTVVNFLIDKLQEEGLVGQVKWLQQQLLEACYSKVKLVRPEPDVTKAQPIAFHFTLSNQSIPLVPWTSEQENAFASPTFRQLLREIGLHLPSDTGRLYPRIPHFWCPDILFAAAKRLGVIPSSVLRVPVEQMQVMMQQMRPMTLSRPIMTQPIHEPSQHWMKP